MYQGLVPDEVYRAWGDLPYLRQVKPDEWHSACPQCGDGGHDPQSGEPNRFYIITEMGNPERTRGTCRRCGYFAFAINILRKQAQTPRLSAAEIEAQDRARQAALAQVAAKKQTAHQKFVQSGLWDALHESLGQEQRSWWRGQGVPDSWQDYWRLGYIADFVFHDRWDKPHHRGPAYSIPFFRLLDGRKTPVTMQYRFVNPGEMGKYWFAQDLGASAFMCRPEESLAGKRVVVVEGAKKAMVTYVHGLQETLPVIGFPSKNSDGGILAELKTAAEVVIILDPDSWHRPENFTGTFVPYPVKFSRAIGAHAKCLRLPHKIDDAILQYGMSRLDFERMFRYARSYPEPR